MTTAVVTGVLAVALIENGVIEVSSSARQVIDESLATIGSGERVEQSTMRRALGAIAGVATMVGQVGVPVVEAVRKVMAAFGI